MYFWMLFQKERDKDMVTELLDIEEWMLPLQDSQMCRLTLACELKKSSAAAAVARQRMTASIAAVNLELGFPLIVVG